MKMLQSLDFDFDRPRDLFNSLYSLRTRVTTKILVAPRTDHLQPLIDASSRSNNRIGRLSEEDLARMTFLGTCTHSKILILLLEPTKKSNSTITWIDSFLRSASGGTLDSTNTAILNCRALVPNASFECGYKDNSPAGTYNFRAVEKSVKKLSPDVILVCQCSVTKNLPNMVSQFTKSFGEAGETSTMRVGKKDCTIIYGFHPSKFAKGVGNGRLRDANAVKKAAPLEFCFLRAVACANGILVKGPGINELKSMAFNEEARLNPTSLGMRDALSDK